MQQIKSFIIFISIYILIFSVVCIKPPTTVSAPIIFQCNSQWRWCNLIKHVDETMGKKGTFGECILEFDDERVRAQYNFPMSLMRNHIWFDENSVSLWEEIDNGKKVVNVMEISYDTAPLEALKIISNYLQKRGTTVLYIHANPHIHIERFLKYFLCFMHRFGDISYLYGYTNIRYYTNQYNIIYWSPVWGEPEEN